MIVELLKKVVYNIFRGTDTMQHSALQVAKWFLAHNRIAADDEGAENISNLKLQKLLYYAQGTFLALKGEKLFSEKNRSMATRSGCRRGIFSIQTIQVRRNPF